MVIQIVPFVWILLGLCCAFPNLEVPSNVASGQSQKQESAVVKCTVSTPNLRWRLKDATTTISVEVELQGRVDMVVMPSVELTALPRKANELEQLQFWAPFDLVTGAGTKEWKPLTNSGEKQRYIVTLVPHKLSWAQTKSSVWPSRAFAETVPPGQYCLQVKLDTQDHKIMISNELTITILK